MFEAIQKKVHGIKMGVHMDLKPVVEREHESTFEMLVVQIKVKNKDIRIITGYGPQENLNSRDRMPFFLHS